MSSSLFDYFEGIQTSSLKEAFEELGFDFKPIKVPTYSRMEDGTEVENPFTCSIVRTDTEEPFVIGSVGPNYSVIPYNEAFSFIEPMVLDRKVKIERGTLIRDGAVAFCLLSTPNRFHIGSDDTIESSFFLVSSHDGSRKIEAYFAPYRHSTGAIMVTSLKPIGIRHTKNANMRVFQAKQVFEKVTEEWESFEEAMRKMLQVKISADDAFEFVSDLYGTSKKAENSVESVMSIFKGSSGYSNTLTICQGTVFGLYQAVVEYEDCFKKVKKSRIKDEKDVKIESRLIGSSARKKAEAYATLLSFVAE